MKILVIRRDNIGDLVCTTPLIRALRERFPDAWIGALVNSYNAPVLRENPDVNELFVYRKAKHREIGEPKLGIYIERAALIVRLRARRIDDVILASPSEHPRTHRFARWLRPQRILVGKDSNLAHEVAKVFAIAQEYGIDSPPPPCRLNADESRIATLRAQFPPDFAIRPIVGLHISARKPSQRWPAERFVMLAKMLYERYGAAFLLFWSPGAADNALHPGDDEKAQVILDGCKNLPMMPVPTHRLEALIAGLGACGSVICCDGGAMHLAAGLGKPIVCLFGQSDAARWHPWGVPYELFQKPSFDVADIDVDEVVAAWGRLNALPTSIRLVPM